MSQLNTDDNSGSVRVLAFRCLVLLLISLSSLNTVAGTVADSQAERLLQAASTQIGVTLSYDPQYRQLSYPLGDVPRSTGVCTDVVIRAYRDAFAIDLQQRVHEDMLANFAKYPKNWGLKKPDRNIDHRRVPNLMRFLARQGASLPITELAADYQAGDIVTWDLGHGITHIGLVDASLSRTGRPLILHNIGAGTQREDILFQFKVIGHYRWLPAASTAATAGSR